MSSGSKLFVGNLAWTTNTGGLQSAFGQFGQVTDAVVMTDRETGRSRGFGFITFSQQSEADRAIEALNESEIDGRQVRVNYANSQGGGGGGGRQGGGGYRGGGNGYQGGSYGGGGYGNQGGQPTYGGGPGGSYSNNGQTSGGDQGWRGSNNGGGNW